LRVTERIILPASEYDNTEEEDDEGSSDSLEIEIVSLKTTNKVEDMKDPSTSEFIEMAIFPEPKQRRVLDSGSPVTRISEEDILSKSKLGNVTKDKPDVAFKQQNADEIEQEMELLRSSEVPAEVLPRTEGSTTAGESKASDTKVESSVPKRRVLVAGRQSLKRRAGETSRTDIVRNANRNLVSNLHTNLQLHETPNRSLTLSVALEQHMDNLNSLTGMWMLDWADTT
jgi:hypothetical protein